jgi:hypothetical protein
MLITILAVATKPSEEECKALDADDNDRYICKRKVHNRIKHLRPLKTYKQKQQYRKRALGVVDNYQI